MRDFDILEDVYRLTQLAGWRKLYAEAMKKLESHESTINRLIFRTRTPIDPLEVEYYRGFRQGVMYVLDGLPNELQAELKKSLAENEGA